MLRVHREKFLYLILLDRVLSVSGPPPIQFQQPANHTPLGHSFSISPGEVLLETTNDEARVHTLEPVRDIQSSDHIIETSWRLGDGIVAVVSACRDDGDNGHVEV